MADNENYRETSNHLHLLLAAGVFVGVALLPVVLRIVQLING
jgi:hypothetical protein